MQCEKCGKQITFLGVNSFNHDGSDGYWDLSLNECEENAAYVETDQNWTGYDLSEEERFDTIRCPYCKQFPFNATEMQVYDIVRVVFFKTDNRQQITGKEAADEK